MQWVDTIVQGALVGGLYALFAAGLSLVFGVMRLVNLAHGDFIILAAFMAVGVVDALGVHPLLAAAVVVPLMAAIGYAAQRLLLNRALGGDILPPLLITFGLSVILQNGLLQGFSADSRKLQGGAIEVASLDVLPGLSIGVFPLLIFLTAVGVIGGLQVMIARTSLGAAIRATSDDQTTARLMGIDNRHIFAVATAIAMAVVGVAGVLMAIRTNFDPAAGPARLLFAFEAVIIGGLGSLWGTLAGGVILGVAQAIGAAIDPGWQVLAGHVVFIAVLVALPRGLFPRAVD